MTKELTPRQKEIAAAALARAESNGSIKNDLIVLEEFAARGIDEEDITPRENVLTYWGWQAKGRQVQKGQSGVKLTTYIPTFKKDEVTGEERKTLRAKTVTVFHVSQTAPFGAPAPAAEKPNVFAKLAAQAPEGGAR